jgi:23S rRNA (pseudouridine1915-N3)-methyltransferase
MKLRVVALGQRMPAWVNAAWDEYARRMPRGVPLELRELRPEPRSSGKSVEHVLAAEAPRVAAACRDATTVALDERGAGWTTRDLADRLARWRIDARDVAFVIGSADGLAASIKQSAHAVVSLSPLTLPHALVRVIVAEQLYRALSLLAGHPYHRE